MNEVETEVWHTVQRLNRAWTTGQADQLREFFHPSMRALTPTDRHVLEGRDACVAAWAKFAKAVKVLRWNEISPRVQLAGPAALVSYRYDLLGEAAGRTLRLEGRDLLVLIREGDRWLAVADAFSEYPASPAPATPVEAPSTQLRSARPEGVDSAWRKRWGLPIVTLWGRYAPADVEGLELLDSDGAQSGLVTWARRGDGAEIVTLDAFRKREGIGSRLMAAAEERLRELGTTRLFLSTTNDNLPAIEFYLRRGYRVVRIARDAMEEVRRLKPGIPPSGQSGIPTCDLWELEKAL